MRHMAGAPAADESATRGLSLPGATPTSKSTGNPGSKAPGAQGSTDPPTQSQDGSPRGADTAPEFKKKNLASKPPRRQASRKRRRHGRRTPSLHVLL